MNRENTAGKRKPAKKILRVFAYILVLAADAYILMFSFSLIIVNGYDAIGYRSSGFGRTVDSVTVDMKSGSGHIAYYPDMSFEAILDTDINVDWEMIRNLKLKMAFSLAPFWFSKYVNPYIMDGVQWKFYFYRGDSQDSVKSVYGSNAYPVGFGGIKKLLCDLKYQELQIPAE